jgi:hypothetical protein
MVVVSRLADAVTYQASLPGSLGWLFFQITAEMESSKTNSSIRCEILQRRAKEVTWTRDPLK